MTKSIVILEGARRLPRADILHNNREAGRIDSLHFGPGVVLAIALGRKFKRRFTTMTIGGGKLQGPIKIVAPSTLALMPRQAVSAKSFGSTSGTPARLRISIHSAPVRAESA